MRGLGEFLDDDREDTDRAVADQQSLVAALVTGLVLLSGSVVVGALAKMRFRGRQLIFYVIVFTMSLPFQVTLIPKYITMVNLRMVDTFFALVIPFSVSAFAILMFRQAFQGLPQALIDAARLDGCSETGIIFRVLWPNIKPVLVTVAILSFIGSWNEVLWPLIVIRDEKLMTMPQLVTLFAVGGRADSQLGVKIAAAGSVGFAGDDRVRFFSEAFYTEYGEYGIEGLEAVQGNEAELINEANKYEDPKASITIDGDPKGGDRVVLATITG